MEEAEDAEIKQALTEAWKALKDAQPPLQQASAEKKRSPLNQALTFEQTRSNGCTARKAASIKSCAKTARRSPAKHRRRTRTRSWIWS
jgi:hypothetical protein